MPSPLSREELETILEQYPDVSPLHLMEKAITLAMRKATEFKVDLSEYSSVPDEIPNLPSNAQFFHLSQLDRLLTQGQVTALQDSEYVDALRALRKFALTLPHGGQFCGFNVEPLSDTTIKITHAASDKVVSAVEQWVTIPGVPKMFENANAPLLHTPARILTLDSVEDPTLSKGLIELSQWLNAKVPSEIYLEDTHVLTLKDLANHYLQQNCERLIVFGFDVCVNTPGYVEIKHIATGFETTNNVNFRAVYKLPNQFPHVDAPQHFKVVGDTRSNFESQLRTLSRTLTQLAGDPEPLELNSLATDTLNTLADKAPNPGVVRVGDFFVERYRCGMDMPLRVKISHKPTGLIAYQPKEGGLWTFRPQVMLSQSRTTRPNAADSITPPPLQRHLETLTVLDLIVSNSRVNTFAEQLSTFSEALNAYRNWMTTTFISELTVGAFRFNEVNRNGAITCEVCHILTGRVSIAPMFDNGNWTWFTSPPKTEEGN